MYSEADSQTEDPQFDSSWGGALPLPDPYPEYVTCPHCGEEEVEVYCYQMYVKCHACGGRITHIPPRCFGTSEKCKGI